jgi:hypothetical protein
VFHVTIRNCSRGPLGASICAAAAVLLFLLLRGLPLLLLLLLDDDDLAVEELLADLLDRAAPTE